MTSAQDQKLPDVLRHANKRHDNSHPQRRTQQHDFTSLAIGKAAPEGRGHRGKEKRDAVNNARPDHIERAVARYAKLFDVERQEGHDQAKGRAGKKTAASRNARLRFQFMGASEG